MPAQTWVEPVVLRALASGWSRSVMTTSPGCARWPSTHPVWRWTIMGEQDEAGLRRWVDTALANAEAGTERPFATVDVATGRVIGSSRYMSIVPEHKRLEIGWTWVGTALAADRPQPRGQAPAAHPRAGGPRAPTGSSSRPMPATSSRGRRCAGSARPSRASTGTTRSCPMARSATRPGSVSRRPTGRE